MGTAAGGQPPPASSARADGRQCSDLRPPGCELALLERTDGSARYDCGDQTKVLVGVYGPVEVRQREELLDRATIQAVFRPLVGVTTPLEKTFEAAVRETASHIIAATLHPRTLIQIVIQVLGNDGSALSAAVNAATLALIDAGISLTELVAAATCAVTEDGVFLLDPTAKEAKVARSLHTFGFLHGTMSKVVLSESTGLYSETEYMVACDLCRQGCVKVFRSMRRAVRRRANRVEGIDDDAEVLEIDSEVANG